MIRPGPSELLEAVARVLEQDVLPALPAGDASQQVKVARSILLRVASVWDRVLPELDEDNRDTETVLRRLSGELQAISAEAPGVLSALDEASPSAEPRRFTHIAQRNETLQSLLIEVQRLLRGALRDARVERVESELRDLYKRSLEREARLSGRLSPRP